MYDAELLTLQNLEVSLLYKKLCKIWQAWGRRRLLLRKISEWVTVRNL